MKEGTGGPAYLLLLLVPSLSLDLDFDLLFDLFLVPSAAYVLMGDLEGLRLPLLSSSVCRGDLLLFSLDLDRVCLPRDRDLVFLPLDLDLVWRPRDRDRVVLALRPLDRLRLLVLLLLLGLTERLRVLFLLLDAASP